MNMKEMTELFDYNLWANNRLFEAAAQIPPEQYVQDLKASHGSIHGTLAHIVGAQKLWLSRWVGKPENTVLKGDHVRSLLDLIGIWETVSSQTAEFLATLDDQKLQENFTITNTAGKQFTNTFQQMMQHLVNHSTAHRGQVSSMMRQLGIRPPTTDLIAYYRRK
jgi:uncharacterized damage-inducible protein DinB